MGWWKKSCHRRCGALPVVGGLASEEGWGMGDGIPSSSSSRCHWYLRWVGISNNNKREGDGDIPLLLLLLSPRCCW
jgi:hypothetical protein